MVKDGITNRLALLSIIDDRVKRDEEFRKYKMRFTQTGTQRRLDRKAFEERIQRMERERRQHTIERLMRNAELEQIKRNHLESTNRKWIKREAEEKERMAVLKTRVANVKKQRHQIMAKERNESLKQEKERLDTELSHSLAIKRQLDLNEEKFHTEINTIKQRADFYELQRQKSRIGFEKTLLAIELRRQQTLEKSLKYFHEQEKKYESETASLEAKVRQLEREREKQREYLKARNDKFDNDLKMRQKLSSSRVKAELKWRKEYLQELKSRLSKRKSHFSSIELNVSNDHINSEEQFIKRQKALEKERKDTDDKMKIRIEETIHKKEKETDKVIEAIQKLDAKKKGKLSADDQKETPKPEPDVEDEESDWKQERQKRFEQEAKEREAARVRNEFLKLMGSFGMRSSA